MWNFNRIIVRNPNFEEDASPEPNQQGCQKRYFSLQQIDSKTA